jgi:hypothetical protein
VGVNGTLNTSKFKAETYQKATTKNRNVGQEAAGDVNNVSEKKAHTAVS